MKTPLNIVICLGVLLIINSKSYAQNTAPFWSQALNTINGAQKFGADAGSTIDLDIRNDAQQNINFSTFGFQRMTIKGLNNHALSTANNEGFVGIGNDRPLTMLHIGDACAALYRDVGHTILAGGWRPWMQKGAYICNESDNMYIGMKTEAFDRDDAVIAWGDNVENGTFSRGPDVLRFIFNEFCNDPNPNPISSSANGAELMRIVPWGNIGVGFDKFYNSGGTVIQPKAQLEVAEDSLQLRLSYDNATTNLVHTDLTTTSVGDLYVFPTDNILPGAGLPSNQFVDIDGRARVRNLPSSNDVNVVVADASGNLSINTNIGGITGAVNATSLNGSNQVEWGTNPLIKQTEIPMKNTTTGDDWSIYFTGQSSMANSLNTASIGIGQSYLSTLNGKLDLSNFTTTGTGFDYINRDGGLFHTHGDYTGDPNGYIFTGVHGICEVQTNVDRITNIGGDFYASRNRKINVGAQGSAIVPNSLSGYAENYGVRGYGTQ